MYTVSKMYATSASDGGSPRMAGRISAAQRDLATKHHALYRFYDRSDVLLYVGITVDLPTRMGNHQTDKPWWADVARMTVEHHAGRRDVLAAERQAIRDERPLYNVQHNELVEVEAEEPEDEAYELANRVIDWLPDGFGETAQRQVMEDSDGSTSVRDLRIAAAEYGVNNLWAAHLLLGRVVGDILGLLPEGRGAAYWQRANATAAERAGDAWDTSDTRTAAAEMLVLDMARSYLDALPHDEAMEWLKCARAAGIKSPEAATRWAALYAANFKDYGNLRSGLCAGPGEVGARCPRKVDRVVFHEVCPNNKPGRCAGHLRWCAQHAEEAAQGCLRMLADDPLASYPIARTELAPDDPWYVPTQADAE